MLFSTTRTSWGCFDAQKGLSELPAHTGCSENVGCVSSAMPAPVTSLVFPYPPQHRDPFPSPLSPLPRGTHRAGGWGQ